MGVYLSLLYSDNQVLRNFGRLAMPGEITCLTAAGGGAAGGGRDPAAAGVAIDSHS